MEVIDITSPFTVHYGLDLYEPAPDDEVAPKEGPPLTIEEADKLMSQTNSLSPANISLLKGLSSETLKEIPWPKTEAPYFFFIDGGHSEETVYGDFETSWEVCKNHKVDMLFDDTNFPGVADGLNKAVSYLREKEFPFDLTKFDHPFFMAMISWG